MRRFSVISGSLLLALALLPQGSAMAAADVEILDVFATPRPGDQSVTLRAWLTPRAEVAKVTFALRLNDDKTPYATLDGTAPGTAGEWWFSGLQPVKSGRTHVDIEVTERDGDKVTKADATYVDSPESVNEITRVSARDATGGTQSAVAGPFRASVRVAGKRQPERIEARLYRAGTNEQVAEFRNLVPESTTSEATDYRSDLLPAQAVGNYDIVATVWDEHGDKRERRSLTQVRQRLAAEFVEIEQDRKEVDADHPDVVITGRLVHRDAEGVLHGAQEVPLRDFHHSEPVTKTGSDGRFRLVWRAGAVNSTTLSNKVFIQADERYADASVEILVYRNSQKTRLSMANTAVAKVGDTTTLTGLLERQGVGDKWVPLADRPLKVYFNELARNPDGSIRHQEKLVAEIRTGTDGRYRFQGTMPATGSWSADFNRKQETAGYSLAQAYTPTLYVEHPTKVEGFTVSPDPVGAGTNVTARGQVLRPKATGSRALAAKGYVFLQYSPDGKAWYEKSEGTTDSQGRFALSGKATADGHWRVLYSGSHNGNGFPETPDAQSFSRTEYVDVRYRTAFTSFNAAPEPVKKGKTLTVSGKLTRDVSGWKPSGKGAKVTIYFQAKGSKTWKAVATTTTDAKGAFKKAFKASQDGTWKAVYAGSTSYLTSTSSTDYVDVR